MSIEKLSAEKIMAITSTPNQERGWRNSEKRNFTDFTAVKTIENANLRSAELNYSDFHGIAFKNVDFSRSEIRYANFDGATFEKCRFDGVDGEFACFKNAKFKDCLMDGTWIFSDFEKTELESCSFHSAEMLFANFEDSVFVECEAMNVSHLNMAKLPNNLGGLEYDTDQFQNI